MERFKLVSRSLIPMVLLVLAMAADSWAVEPKITKIHEGRHWIWYAREDQFHDHETDIKAQYDYADQAFDRLVEAWGISPPNRTYALLVWPKTGGGFAVGDIAELHDVVSGPQPGIAVSYDAFFNEEHGIKGFWAVAIITHEMTNLFSGQLVSGGWPVDWWADHISPFPKMTAVQIEYDLRPDVAVEHAKQMDSPLDHMFAKLKDQFGWSLFRRAFAAAREDGIDWERIGRNPSALRTNYVCAYLQLAAPEGLHAYLQGVVPGYDRKAVEDILTARKKWRDLPKDDAGRTELREKFLRGEVTKATPAKEQSERP